MCRIYIDESCPKCGLKQISCHFEIDTGKKTNFKCDNCKWKVKNKK